MKSQLDWFYKNCHPKDLHYQISFKNNLIGYLHLGMRTFENSNKKYNFNNKYILFRNLIINKNFRSKGIADEIMNFANKYIQRSKFKL